MIPQIGFEIPIQVSGQLVEMDRRICFDRIRIPVSRKKVFGNIVEKDFTKSCTVNPRLFKYPKSCSFNIMVIW